MTSEADGKQSYGFSLKILGKLLQKVRSNNGLFFWNLVTVGNYWQVLMRRIRRIHAIFVLSLQLERMKRRWPRGYY